MRIAQCVQYFAETSFRVANKQENEEFLREKIDIFLDLIQDDDREALRAFVSYLGNMFGQVLTDEDIDQINNPLKVKEGIMHLAERIEQNNLRRIEQVRQESIEQGKQEGIEQGIERGIEQGMKKKAQETARNMLAEGYPLEAVQRITDLSPEELKSLQ